MYDEFTAYFFDKDRFKNFINKNHVLRVKMLAVVLASVVFASVDATAGVSLWHLDYSADCKYLFLYRLGFRAFFFPGCIDGYIYKRKNIQATIQTQMCSPRGVAHLADTGLFSNIYRRQR